MGIFSDTCQALIDPTTNRALTGEALEQAKQNPKAPRCGKKVKKAARFCGKCGAPAPGGWWKCPSCAKWVGNESNFCWNCNTPLYPDARAGIAGGRWQRPAGVFAERFEVGDINALLKEGLIIEQGTSAILLDGGAYKDTLGPGRHDLDSCARKINWWGNPPPRTVILVDNGDVVLPLRVAALRTSEDIPVELYTEVAFHFVEKQAGDFIANLFKNNQRLTYQEIETVLTGEIRYAMENIANTGTIEDLIKDPQRRLHIEDALQKTLEGVLKRYGLEIVRVAAAEFTGKEYEELRVKSGEVEIKRRSLEFDQRLRELLASDKMDQFKTAHELEEYVAQLAQERDVAGEHRSHEMNRLKQVHRHEMTREEALFQMTQDMQKASHDISIKTKSDDYSRDKTLKDTEAEAQAAERWLKVRAEKQRLKQEDLAATARIMEGQSIQTLIALLPDPAQREHLLQLNRQLQQAGRSPEEILAMASEHSPAAADALAKFAGLNREQLEREFAERKKLSDENAERLERILKAALETTAEAARRPGSGTQIIR